MDKKMLPIVILFLCIGLFVMAIGVFFAVGQYQFAQTAQQTMGEVTALIPQTDSDGTTYAPELGYMVNGQRYSLVSNYSSNPASYAVGDSVVVFYDPTNPDSAKMGTTVALYGGPVIAGGIGIVFVCIGGIMLGVYVKRKKDILWLRHQGQAFHGTIASITQDMAYNMNGKHPYRIVVNVSIPGDTQKTRELKSDLLWKDPNTVTKIGDSLNVYIDMANTKRYYIDLSAIQQKL